MIGLDSDKSGKDCALAIVIMDIGPSQGMNIGY